MVMTSLVCADFQEEYMITKVVFFVVSPFQNRDYDRFGIEVLKGVGFEVEVYDLSPYVFPSLYARGVKRDRSNAARTVQSEKEALKIIAGLSAGCFVFMMMHFWRGTFRLFKAVTRFGLPYAVCVTTPVPSYSIFRSFRKKIAWSLLTKIMNYCTGYPFRPRFARFWGVQEPAYFLAGGDGALRHEMAAMIGKKTETLWLHSWDYDIYLKDIHQKLQLFEDGRERVVFLDAPGPKFMRDDLTKGKMQCPLTEERHYPSLCSFFRLVERHFDVQVEIAGHPGAEHEMYPPCFEGRLTLHGRTFDMIRRARFVIARESAAIAFAVIMNKPVIFITTDEAETDPELSNDIAAMASALGKKPVNINRLGEIDLNREIGIDTAAYAAFRNEYIKRDGTEDLNSWRIVANRIRGPKPTAVL